MLHGCLQIIATREGEPASQNSRQIDIVVGANMLAKLTLYATKELMQQDRACADIQKMELSDYVREAVREKNDRVAAIKLVTPAAVPSKSSNG